MKLQILVNGHAVEVKSEDLGGVVQVEPGVYSVLVEGRSFEARAIRNDAGIRLELDGRRFAAEVRDPRDRGQKSAAALGSGRQNVFAPMPGKVIRVLVREGDAVDDSVQSPQRGQHREILGNVAFEDLRRAELRAQLFHCLF